MTAGDAARVVASAPQGQIAPSEGAPGAPPGDEAGAQPAGAPFPRIAGTGPGPSGLRSASAGAMQAEPGEPPPTAQPPHEGPEQPPAGGLAAEAGDQGIAALAAEIAQRDPHPIDELEVTALLESSGVTDAVACQRYGAADVFHLAGLVLARVRSAADPPAETGNSLNDSPSLTPLPRPRLGEVLPDLARGFLGLVPILVLFLLMRGYSNLGHWGQHRLLALSAGVSASILVTNGFIQAASYRAFTYLGMGDPRAAGWFLQRSTALSALCVSVIGLVGLALVSRLVRLDPGDLFVFAAAFGAFSAIWLVGARLSVVGKPFWMPVALIGGVLIAFVADRTLSLVWGMHLAAATALGFAATMGLMLTVEARHYRGGKVPGKERPVRLPSLGYLLLEALPPFAYGSLYMVFIFAPHVLGWLGALRHGQSPMLVLASLEVGLVLSMPPIIMLAGAAEYWLKRFWRHVSAELLATPSGNAARFDRCLTNWYRTHLLHYGIALTALSVADYGAFRLAFDRGYLSAALGVPSAGPVSFTFVAGLIAYWLLGLGVYNAMFCTTLGRADLPARAVALATIVTVATGVPLSFLGDFTYSTIAFICGSATFFGMSQWMTARMMKHLHYYYLSSQ